MIRKTANRLNSYGGDHSQSPSRRHIEDVCRTIRSRWSSDQKRRRSQACRIDEGDLRYQAHLRFIQFLIEKAEIES